MLSLTTRRHQLFVNIRGCSGDDFSSYAESIDRMVDVVLEKCKRDNRLLSMLAECKTRAEAYCNIAVHMDADIVKQHIASDICRRVLYLLCPDRFGFEKFGWIH